MQPLSHLLLEIVLAADPQILLIRRIRGIHTLIQRPVQGQNTPPMNHGRDWLDMADLGIANYVKGSGKIATLVVRRVKTIVHVRLYPDGPVWVGHDLGGRSEVSCADAIAIAGAGATHHLLIWYILVC